MTHKLFNVIVISQKSLLCRISGASAWINNFRFVPKFKLRFVYVSRYSPCLGRHHEEKIYQNTNVQTSEAMQYWPDWIACIKILQLSSYSHISSISMHPKKDIKEFLIQWITYQASFLAISLKYFFTEATSYSSSVRRSFQSKVLSFRSSWISSKSSLINVRDSILKM